jgi:hypothetical protein
MAAELHEIDRKEIFRQIVRLQDEGVSLNDTRRRVSEEWGIDIDVVREIETEGIKSGWPPL